MLKNTKLLIVFLAIFATFVAGVNIGRNIYKSDSKLNQDLIDNKPSPIPNQAPQTQTPKINIIKYDSKSCNLTMGIPENSNKLEAGDGNVVFIDPKDPQNSALLICQDVIPKPSGDLIEKDIKIGSASADIYQESSSSGQPLPIYHLYFTHPISKLQVLLSGSGQLFEAIANTINIK